MTQTENIERHMREFGSITTNEAFIEYGCTRLPARIWDLEHHKGLRINRRMESGKNRFGEVVNFARYSLEK